MPNKIVIKRSIFLGIFLIAIQGCQPHDTKPVPAFYYWQTELALSEYESRVLDSLAIKKIYVKFFDVDWDLATQMAVPLASLAWQSNTIHNIAIIPTVFITNRTLENTSPTVIPELAKRIGQKITTLLDGYPVQEIQLDCDWNSSTRVKFFELLRQVKSYFPDISISCTIRLHQVKFSDQTGIPPADKGMLMFYNMGEINDWETENSILDLELSKAYLAKLKTYPLPLDLALPIYSWGVIYRNANLYKLVHQLQIHEIADTSKYALVAPNRYLLKTNTLLRGHFLESGDQIRIETVHPATLMASAKLLAAHLPRASRTIAYYHLDEQALQQFSTDFLARIFTVF